MIKKLNFAIFMNLKKKENKILNNENENFKYMLEENYKNRKQKELEEEARKKKEEEDKEKKENGEEEEEEEKKEEEKEEEKKEEENEKKKKKQLKNKPLKLIGGEFRENEETTLPKIPAQILSRKNGFDYENASEPLEKK